MDAQWEVAEGPRVGRPPAVRPESFRHTLHILQVADPHYESLWWAYLDEPGKWRTCNVGVGRLLSIHAAKILAKVAQWEARQRSGRNPNFVGGGNRPGVPTEHLAHWAVLVELDRGEGEPEWSVSILDDGAWGAVDYRVEALMRKLAQRIGSRAGQFAAGNVRMLTADSHDAEEAEGQAEAEAVVEQGSASVAAVTMVAEAEPARARKPLEIATTEAFEAAIRGLIEDAEVERTLVWERIARSYEELRRLDERLGAYKVTLEAGLQRIRAGERRKVRRAG